MASAPPPPTPAPAPEPTRGTDRREIFIYEHSPIFYFWPVWVVGYLMALITYLDPHRLAIVPKTAQVAVANAAADPTYTITAAGKSETLATAAAAQANNTGAFQIHMSNSYRLGAVFCTVLLLVIVITNLPLRGVWSIVVIIVVVALGVILVLAEVWDQIINTVLSLRIYINLAGYLYISTGLLLMWLVALFFFDRQTYMVFTPGQFKVCLEIGGGETAYDTMGMTIQKKRDDFFRHWLLGLGSGDLSVRTSGAHSHEFDMHNVLNVGAKLRLIEEMQRDRPTVQG